MNNISAAIIVFVNTSLEITRWHVFTLSLNRQGDLYVLITVKIEITSTNARSRNVLVSSVVDKIYVAC